MTSKARWLSIRETVFAEQRKSCAVCKLPFTSHEDMHGHHAIYTRQKGLDKWLDTPENIVLLCQKCHADHGHLTAWFRRNMFWTAKIDAGYDMLTWHENMPMLIKDHFIYVYDPFTKGTPEEMERRARYE